MESKAPIRIVAPLGKRTLALLVDAGIISIATYVVAGIYFIALLAFLAFGPFAEGFSQLGTGEPVRVIERIAHWALNSGQGVGIVVLVSLLMLLLVLLVVFDGYFIWFEYKRGATPGKKLFGLQVVTAEGGAPSLRQCVIREVLRFVDLGLLIPGIASVLLDRPKRRRLGDFASGCWVVYSPSKEQNTQSMYMSFERYETLKKTLSPPVPPVEVCRRYLAFAFPHFILGNPSSAAASSREELARWEELALQHLPGVFQADHSYPGRQMILLFFAEHCFQSLKNK